MNTKLQATLLFALFMLLQACGSDNDTSKKTDGEELNTTQLELSDYHLEIELEGGEVEVTVKANGSWQIVELPDWIQATPNKNTSLTGVVDTKIQLTVQGTDNKSRLGVLRIEGGEISKELEILQKVKLQSQEGALIIDHYTGGAIAHLITAGTLSEMIAQAENADVVTSLQLLGNINKADIEASNSLPISKLDLLDAHIENDGIWEQHTITEQHRVKELILPQSTKKIANHAFSLHHTLQQVRLPLGLEEIGKEAFRLTNALLEMYIPSTVHTVGKYAFASSNIVNIYFGEDTEQPKGVSQLTTIAAGTFSKCKKLRTIQIPAQVSKIETQAFMTCTILNSISLPEGLKTIEKQAFCNAEQLQDIEIPNSVETIGTAAFLGNINLRSIKLSNKLTEIENETFEYCYMLKNITIPEGVIQIGNYAFAYCSGLENVNLPNTLKYLGGAAFSGCVVLKEIKLPNGLEQIVGSTFTNTALEEITLPASLTLLGGAAFYTSKNLEAVTFEGDIPALKPSIKWIFGDTKLSKVYLKASTPQTILPAGASELFDDKFKANYTETDKGIIYVPSASLELYKTHWFWSQYNIEKE